MDVSRGTATRGPRRRDRRARGASSHRCAPLVRGRSALIAGTEGTADRVGRAGGPGGCHSYAASAGGHVSVGTDANGGAVEFRSALDGDRPSGALPGPEPSPVSRETAVRGRSTRRHDSRTLPPSSGGTRARWLGPNGSLRRHPRTGRTSVGVQSEEDDLHLSTRSSAARRRQLGELPRCIDGRVSRDDTA